MSSSKNSRISRRQFVMAAGAAPFLLFPTRMLAQSRTLRIAQWTHLLPEYDLWFDDYARQWGRQHDTHVIVDHLPLSEINAHADAEVAASNGHDLFMFPVPPAVYQKHVIDHHEIYDAVSRRHGNVVELAHRSTFNPDSNTYFAFCDSFLPAPLLFQSEAWAAINLPLGPASYAELLAGGQKIRAKTGLPCGLSFAPGLAGNITLLGMMWSFGCSVTNEDGTATLNSARTLGALRLAKQLYENAGSSQMLRPTAMSAISRAESSCTVNAISEVRRAEETDPGIAKRIRLSPPMHGVASRRLAAPWITSCYVIWKFAQNKSGAQQFLMDLVDASATSFEKSRYCNFPCFPSLVPNLVKRLANDERADPPFKYKELEDALHWTRNIGFPGYSTAGAMELFQRSVVPRMFCRVISGETSAEVAAASAQNEAEKILQRSQCAA